MIIIQSTDHTELRKWGEKYGINQQMEKSYQVNGVGRLVLTYTYYIDPNKDELMPKNYAQKALLAGTDV